MLGAFDGLPFSLVLAFCFTPSVSTAIFRAWLCKAFYYSDDPSLKREFLVQDPMMSCDDDPRYDQMVRIAWVLVAIWPIGMLVSATIPPRSCQELAKNWSWNLSKAPTSPGSFAQGQDPRKTRCTG